MFRWHCHENVTEPNNKESRVDSDAAQVLASSPKDVLNSTVFSCWRKAANINMYRGITLSPVLSKVFKSVWLHLYDFSLLATTVWFNENNSCCNHALFTVTESVKYFISKASRVCGAFLDASKAFLIKFPTMAFSKELLEREAPVVFVRLLPNWCGNLQCRVRWNDVWGEQFTVYVVLVKEVFCHLTALHCILMI